MNSSRILNGIYENNFDGEYTVMMTKSFRKDYKRVHKSGYDKEKLWSVVRILAKGSVLPLHYQDHALSGDMTGQRECHIGPDWLLIYAYDHHAIVLTLTRTGTHAQLFKR